MAQYANEGTGYFIHFQQNITKNAIVNVTTTTRTAECARAANSRDSSMFALSACHHNGIL